MTGSRSLRIRSRSRWHSHGDHCSLVSLLGSTAHLACQACWALEGRRCPERVKETGSVRSTHGPPSTPGEAGEGHRSVSAEESAGPCSRGYRVATSRLRMNEALVPGRVEVKAQQ